MKDKKLLLISITALILVGCVSSPTTESTGQYLDSSIITSRVKSQLLISKGIDSADIKVSTYKDTVQLSGFVASQAQKDSAAQITAGVAGVNGVINNLVVKAP